MFSEFSINVIILHVSSFAPPNLSHQDHNPSWLYEYAGEQWVRWLSPDCLSTFKKGGHYSTKLIKGLRIIALNTNYCARLNPWSLYDPVDPGGQLAFLRDQLLEAEKSKESVHIIGHVPVDHRECTEAWIYNYIRLMERFGYLIKAQYFGHTHRDEFRVVYGNDGASSRSPIAFQFIGPSITPYSSTNPSYRIYEVDSRTYEVVNYQTYFFNLTESNNGGGPKWRLEYEAKTDLLGKDAREGFKEFKREESPKLPINHHSLHEVLERLYGRSRTLDNKHENDRTSGLTGLPFNGDRLFSDYYKRYYVQSDLMMSLTASLTPDVIKKNTILRDHSVEDPFTREGGPNSLIQPLV